MTEKHCAQATLCGVWAALQWPAADVRVVTMGSPAVGNDAFARVSALCALLCAMSSRSMHSDLCPVLL